jgi:hypothetical protein
MTNTFWIAANIIFELGTGKTTPVLMLVNRLDDASFFATEHEAQTYLSFVQTRAPNIQWFIDPPISPRPPIFQTQQGFVIRGVQTTPGR